MQHRSAEDGHAEQHDQPGDDAAGKAGDIGGEQGFPGLALLGQRETVKTGDYRSARSRGVQQDG